MTKDHKDLPVIGTSLLHTEYTIQWNFRTPCRSSLGHAKRYLFRHRDLETHRRTRNLPLRNWNNVGSPEIFRPFNTWQPPLRPLYERPSSQTLSGFIGLCDSVLLCFEFRTSESVVRLHVPDPNTKSGEKIQILSMNWIVSGGSHHMTTHLTTQRVCLNHTPNFLRHIPFRGRVLDRVLHGKGQKQSKSHCNSGREYHHKKGN